MNANVLVEYGKSFSKVFQYVQNFPKPVIKDDEVLVKMHNASVNPVDYKMAYGTMKLVAGVPSFPFVLGRDGSGVIAEVGKSVTRFKPGDRVFGSTDFPRPGTFAEYTAFKESELGHIPSSLSFSEAAALPIVLLTMYQCFMTVPGGMNPSKNVLILGGSGGTGSIGVMLAKYYFKCNKVYATCSTKNVTHVQNLGADRVIDYTKEEVDKVIQQDGIKLDVLIDTVGQKDTFDKCMALVKDSSQNGTGVTIAAMSSSQGVDETSGGFMNMSSMAFNMLWSKLKSFVTGPNFYFVIAKANGAQLDMLGKWLHESNVLHTNIISNMNRLPLTHFALKDLDKAMEMSSSKKTVGKIIIDTSHTDTDLKQ